MSTSRANPVFYIFGCNRLSRLTWLAVLKLSLPLRYAILAIYLLSWKWITEKVSTDSLGLNFLLNVYYFTHLHGITSHGCLLQILCFLEIIIDIRCPILTLLPVLSKLFSCPPEFGRPIRSNGKCCYLYVNPSRWATLICFFVCSLTRRLQDCFNKTLIHWRPWWMTWIGRYLIRCGWHDLNISFIFYLNIRKQNKCFASRLRWSAMKPALPFRSLTLVKKTIVLIWRQKYNVNLMQTGFVDKLISKLLQQVKALESNS